MNHFNLYALIIKKKKVYIPTNTTMIKYKYSIFIFYTVKYLDLVVFKIMVVQFIYR